MICLLIPYTASVFVCMITWIKQLIDLLIKFNRYDHHKSFLSQKYGDNTEYVLQYLEYKIHLNGKNN